MASFSTTIHVLTLVIRSSGKQKFSRSYEPHVKLKTALRKLTIISRGPPWLYSYVNVSYFLLEEAEGAALNWKAKDRFWSFGKHV